MKKPLLATFFGLMLAGCQNTSAPACPFDPGSLVVPPMVQLGVKAVTGASWESFSLKLSKAEFIADGHEVAYPFQHTTVDLMKAPLDLYGRAIPIQSDTFSKVRLTFEAVTGVLRQETGTRSVKVQLESPLELPQPFTPEGNIRTVMLITLNLGALVVESSESVRIPNQAIGLVTGERPADFSPEGFKQAWVDCSRHLSLTDGNVAQEEEADLKIRLFEGQAAFQGFGAIADLGDIPLSEIKRVPQSGFTNLTKAIEGHSYVVRTRDGKYAKLYLSHLLKRQDHYAAWVEYYLQENGSWGFSR